MLVFFLLDFVDVIMDIWMLFIHANLSKNNCKQTKTDFVILDSAHKLFP